jgi:6-phosphofructokinase 1
MLRGAGPSPDDDLSFELAGPRSDLFFDPSTTTAAIVTCGGLCPGLNNVVRSIFMELHHAYRVPRVLGFRYGYQGLDPQRGTEPLVLTPEVVHGIHRWGGTILGTSRGAVDVEAAVDSLVTRNVQILFTVGGDGTQRGGQAFFEAARRRGHTLAVVGVPKTIDNDVAFVSRSFGFLTAVKEAARVLDGAHTEALGVENGLSLVKLMGRHAGFIAAAATVASSDVNICLVPEVPFALKGPGGLLAAIVERLRTRRHAVVVVAEGAGQDLLPNPGDVRDASGNVKLEDIGAFLRVRIEAHCRAAGVPATIRYFDPSYSIRSVPADAEDAILADLFARHAVHAGMAGKTGLVIGLVHGQFVHVPIEYVTSRTKRLDPQGDAWRAVLAATGQPARFA